jgi:hypothetical protein
LGESIAKRSTGSTKNVWRKERDTKDILRKFREKDDDKTRIEHWESRKAYERTVKNRRCIWQEKVAEYITKLDRRKLRKYGKP